MTAVACCPLDDLAAPAAPAESLVYVVDDVPAIVDLASRYLAADGEFRCYGFSSTAELLRQFVPGAADCVVIDLKLMGGLDGDELHRLLAQRDPCLSFVYITAYADVRTAVRLMEQGALTLLEKPFSAADLLAAVRRGAERTRSLRQRSQSVQQAATLLTSLTREELDVLDLILAGLPNRGIAQRLAISVRTVDRRRQSIMQKTLAGSVAELAALVTRARGDYPPAR